MKFQSDSFPKYNQLSILEKFILRTCCYYPPKKRRERSKLIIEVEKYQNTLTNAFGESFWKLIENKRALDFGCGEGGFVIGMASKVDCIAEGVDIQSQFDVANTYIKENNIRNTKFHLGSSEKLQDESYDLIISHDSFEHFDDPKEILSEMVRLLKPGGYLLIKFGPTWKSPYGRHMGGTYKKSRPWIHLLIPEKNMMRVHSVYHNEKRMKTQYTQLKGGLNKMTITRAKEIISQFENIDITKQRIDAWRNLWLFTKFPLTKEFFGSAIYFEICKKI